MKRPPLPITGMPLKEDDERTLLRMFGGESYRKPIPPRLRFKSLFSYRTKEQQITQPNGQTSGKWEGKPCGVGVSAERTGCIPKKEEQRGIEAKPTEQQVQQPATTENKPAMSKDEAKRIMASIKTPEHLPENHNDYFDIPSNAIILPLDKLRNIRARPEGIENVARFMEGARQGLLPKRKPISVFKEDDGTYSVIDGNSTFANAKANGWKTIPVIELTKEEAEAQKAKDEAHAKEKAAKVKPMFDSREMSLPKDARQPIKPDAGYATLLEKGKEADKQLQALLDLGKGIGAQLGYKTLPPTMTEEQVLEHLKEPGGFVVLGPIKGEKRSTEKTNLENGGDWSKLLDIARASVAVDSIDELHTVVDKLRSSGIEFARAPKDRIAKPTPVGYHDILTNIRMPNGIVVELQLHLKPILIAKAQGHKQFETLRTLDGTAKQRSGNADISDEEARLFWTPEELAAHDKAFEESQVIYNTAWQKAVGK